MSNVSVGVRPCDGGFRDFVPCSGYSWRIGRAFRPASGRKKRKKLQGKGTTYMFGKLRISSTWFRLFIVVLYFV